MRSDDLVRTNRNMDLLRSLEGEMPLGVPVTTNHEIRQEVCSALHRPAYPNHYV